MAPHRSGCATDGGLKFDLTKLDQSYFDRMRARTITAGQNGIYVSIMLFNGFEWQFDTNPKDGDPFVATNNINHISCPDTCPTDNARIPDAAWEIETAYIRKVVGTMNDLDNVLYEVSNEAGRPTRIPGRLVSSTISNNTNPPNPSNTRWA